MPTKELDSDAVNFNRMGKHRIVGGRVIWDPPANIDPALRKQLEKALQVANKMIAAGTLVVRNGKIFPANGG